MEELNSAISVLRRLLPTSPTVQDIEYYIDNLVQMPIFANLDKNKLIREIQELVNVQAPDYAVIEDEGVPKSWLPAKSASIDWKFWNRYRDYLQLEKNYPDAVLTRLSNLTDDVLDMLFDPTIERSIDKRGLVVGQVQSGKTSNYIGLICKASDVGYKIIIIMAGIHNNLRSQTQLRIDEGFFGKDSQTLRVFEGGDKILGAGKYNVKSKSYVAHPITSSHENGDFNRNARIMQGLDFDTDDPIVFVVKKNGPVLRNLYEWLASNAGKPDEDGHRLIQNKPLLLIDDEADNASINTSKHPDRATKINSQIRSILRLFDRSAYVGYTATPFANIFIPIEADELFPRNFIINLPAPSNYIGPEKVFGFEPLEEDESSDYVLPIVYRIEDFQSYIPNGHKKDDPLPDGVPDSLQLAIRCFILTCAIRRLRGQKKAHNSMLVHVTRFMRWQKQIKELVEVEFDYYRRGIEQNDPAILEIFRQTFENDKPGYRSYKTVTSVILGTKLRELDSAVQIHEWPEVVQQLYEAAARIRVREINGGSTDALNYFDTQEGLSVIAIGGDKLSRGLTLEGLSVSYYLRASRMYDTLMQMGRWFGYRHGYVDLCRLFTSTELNEWYCHITRASEELREEFVYMSEVAGVTPEQYALKVRTHPGVLQITASNKMFQAENLRVGFSGRLVQSYLLRNDKESIRNNFNTSIKFLTELGTPDERPSRLVWTTNNWQLVNEFVKKFIVHPELARAKPDLVSRYIEMTRNRGELTDWVVAMPITSKSGSRKYTFTFGDIKLEMGLFQREREEGTSNEKYYINNSNIISPRHELYDFENCDNLKGPKRPILNTRPASRALLLLYPLDPVTPKGIVIADTDIPIMGYAISFPNSNVNVQVEYAVHKQLLPLFDVNDLTDSDYENED